MKARSSVAVVAALAGGVICASETFAQVTQQALTAVPATYRGTATCGSRYPGSFLDIGRGECWQCPSSHPNRTIFPVTASNACERPATEVFRRAAGPERPTGLIGTDCRSGYFLDIGKRACYSCSGYNRTAYPIDHARACARTVPAAWTSATRRGPTGCPAGSFRNGLTDHCYSCPTGYFRNAVIAPDLTKVNACTHISSAAIDAVRAKFNQYKDSLLASRANLGRTPAAVTTYETAQRIFDMMSRDLMKSALDDELSRGTGLNTVSWLASVGASAGVGYAHGQGFVMTKVGGTYRCWKAWSNTFTGGFAAGGGVVLEVGLARGTVTEGASESNGWQAGASYPPVTGGMGLHWDAASGDLSIAIMFGPGFAADVNLSEYVHTWAATGKMVNCDSMTWGLGWANL